MREQGYSVYAADTDGFGTIEHNAEQLKAQILKILKQENAEKVNLIAHSKGGLDSKYMLRELGMTKKVASLTTLCTPHRGSAIASWMYRKPKWALKFLAFWINLWYKIFGDKKPDALTVCKQLQALPNDILEQLDAPEGVYCQSYSSTMEKSRDDFLMTIPHLISRHYEGATDGLVSVESAKFAEYRGDMLEETLSHSQEIGFCLGKKKRSRVYEFYLALAAELAERGL